MPAPDVRELAASYVVYSEVRLLVGDRNGSSDGKLRRGLAGDAVARAYSSRLCCFASSNCSSSVISLPLEALDEVSFPPSSGNAGEAEFAADGFGASD